MSGNDSPANLTERFRNELNKHGYPFQFAAADASRRAFENAQWRGLWKFEACEFPVIVQGQSTRIDLILKHAEANIYLLIECKRVDPALADWCFARFPYVSRTRTYEAFLAEEFVRKGLVTGSVYMRDIREEYYSIGLEVKDPTKKGDGTGGGRGAIEAAASQACRGLNGMVECFAARPKSDFQAFLIPVIFTTARLWGCEVSLTSATDIETGRIPAENMEDLKALQVVLYQYHQSPGLKHTRSVTAKSETLGEILDLAYIRTIPIVTATGIESFLAGFDPTVEHPTRS